MTDAPANMAKSLELQMLTLSDPAARANMLRHIAAVRLLFTDDIADAEHHGLLIGSGFGISDDAEEQCYRSVAADGVSRLYLMFDVDDALGPPYAYGLFHREDGETVFYHYAGPWMPLDGGKPLISASNGKRAGFFVYRRGRLRRAAKPPASDFKPGYSRAATRIAALLRTPGIRDFAPDPVFTLFQS